MYNTINSKNKPIEKKTTCSLFIHPKAKKEEICIFNLEKTKFLSWIFLVGSKSLIYNYSFPGHNLL